MGRRVDGRVGGEANNANDDKTNTHPEIEYCEMPTVNNTLNLLSSTLMHTHTHRRSAAHPLTVHHREGFLERRPHALATQTAQLRAEQRVQAPPLGGQGFVLDKSAGGGLVGTPWRMEWGGGWGL